MGDFGELEELDGVRMPWNIWPSSRVEALKCVIPFSALYTPNKPLQHLQVMDYEPVACKNCGGILNPFSSCDFTAHLWICPLCFGRNHFPAQYNGINEQMLPAELFQEYTTIEYRLPALKPVYAPAYVFVVDTCLSEEELKASQGAISQALQMIPEYARVALVTFGTHVQVYELGFDVLNKSYVFQGSKEYTAQQVQSQLGIGPSTASRQPASPSRPGMKAQQLQDPIAFAARRFILPVSECEFTISAAIEGLRKDAFPSVADHRPSRCTGTAIQVAAGMMAGCLPAGSCAARIMLFAGGPPTVGSGKVVDMELVQPIRSHKDLMKEAAPHYKKARKFYDGLAAQLVQQGHALDVFACSLDQVGLAEMQTAVEQTGGLLVQASTFNAQAFKESFRRIFAPPTEEGHLGMNSNAQFEVVCSRDVKVAGLLGSAASLEAKSSAVAEQQVGLGGTTKWRLASLAQSTTVGVFFEIMTSKKQESAGLADGAAGQTFYIQFITKYLNGQTGRTHCRVSTITRQWVEGGNLATWSPIMNSITASMGKKGPTWSREFDSLIRAIGECKSKAEEDALISKEVEILKPRLKDPKMDKRWLKELLVRLIYVEMLGQDASWAHVKALQACSETNLITKKVAYLASSLFLDYKDDTIILVVNTLSTDLKSDNYLVVCSALTAICKLISPDLINAVLPRTLELLTHPKELVRKKAVMALDRYLQLDPERDGPLAGVDLDRHLRQALCDKDPSVMSAALCALQEAIQRDPKPYKNLIPSFVSILKQVAEHRLPKAFDHHRTPAPFLQIKLLRILGQLGASDKQASDNMYAVVADSMRRGNTGHTIGNAIVYEAVRTIANIYPNPTLLQSAAEMISAFLKSSSHNLKYVGIDGLARIVRINPKYAAEHQLAVIDCLEDPDDMLKKKTLELLYKMTKPNNVEVIVDKMVDYLRTTNDEVTKTEVVKRIGELAERFAPDTQWFLDTMNQVFELGGDVVSPQLANSLMRLIAEGAGEEDDQADTELRAQAVGSYLDLLDKPKLSAVLLKVICWVLGEYGTLAGVPVDSVIDKLAGILDTQNVTDSVRGYLITALGKLCSQAQCNLSPQAHQLLHDAANSRNLDLQQHALEVQALLGGAVQTRQAGLPPDASCEDLQIDVSLPFLNSFVQQAVEQGAAPYISQQQRASMGVMPTSRHHEVAEQPHALRFAAYEKAQAPGAAQPQHNLLDGFHQQAASQQSSSRSSSPVKGVHGDAGPAPAAQSAATPSSGGGEPQLTLRGAGGARRWGPAHFEAAPAAVTAASTSARPPAAAAHATPAASTAAAEPHRPVASAVEPHVPTQKELLAASLFGDSSSRPARQRRQAAHHAAPAAHHAASTQPAAVATSAAAQPAATDLLLALDSPGPTASAATAVSSDPFAALEGVAPPAAVASPAATPNLVDLDDLYDAPAPVQAPISQDSPFGSMQPQNQQAPAHAAHILQPVSAMPAAVSQAKAHVLQPQKPAPVAGGPAPMAPRGNAAVEQQAGRKDPFADLFS